MLTYHDEPIIRNGVTKRLDKERGVRVIDVKTKPGDGCLRVRVLATIDDVLHINGKFELPPEFDYKHLHNEIDQLAEQAKEARRDFWAKGRPERVERMPLRGTGMRGLWARHA